MLTLSTEHERNNTMQENRLAHILWQAAKFLVSLLEKEYWLKKNSSNP